MTASRSGSFLRACARRGQQPRRGRAGRHVAPDPAGLGAAATGFPTGRPVPLHRGMSAREPGRRRNHQDHVMPDHQAGRKTRYEPMRRESSQWRRTICASTSPGAQTHWHQTARPRAWWPVIPSKGGACSATASCCSTTPGYFSPAAGPSPLLPQLRCAPLPDRAEPKPRTGMTAGDQQRVRQAGHG
jgi:hypothetical protein